MVEVSNHNDCVLNREPDQLIFRFFFDNAYTSG